MCSPFRSPSQRRPSPFFRGQKCATRSAGERHSPHETTSRAPDVRGDKVRVVAPMVCAVISAVSWPRIGVESRTSRTEHARRAKERPRGTCGIPKRSSPSSRWSQRRTKDQSNLGLQAKRVRANPDQSGTSTARYAILTKQELWP